MFYVPDDSPPFPSDEDVTAVLEEFGGDARAAIRALLADLDSLARDYRADVSKGYVRLPPSPPKRRLRPHGLDR